MAIGRGLLEHPFPKELYVNITQKVAKPLVPPVAARLVSDLGAWRVHRPGVEDILDAIRLQPTATLSAPILGHYDCRERHLVAPPDHMIRGSEHRTGLWWCARGEPILAVLRVGYIPKRAPICVLSDNVHRASDLRSSDLLPILASSTFSQTLSLIMSTGL